MSQKPSYEELEDRIKALEHALHGNSNSENTELPGSVDNADLKDFEGKLRVSKSPLEAIFNQSFQFALILDKNGKILRMNNLCQEVCGKLARDAVGAPVWTAGWWESFSETQEMTKKAVREVIRGKTVRDEVSFFDRDKQIRRGIRVFSPIVDELGNIQLISLVGLDITERQRIEDALHESEEVMRYIIKHDPNAIAVYDNNLNYIAVSDRYLFDYNIADSGIIGKHHYEVFPEMPERWKEVHKRVLSGAIERNDDDSFERSDGSITYNRWECRPWYNASGSIGGMITYTEVTTERKLAQIKLQQSELRYRNHFMQYPTPIFAWKRVEDIFILSDFNRAAEEITGGLVKNYEGIAANELYADIHSEHILHTLEACYRRRISTQKEFRYTLKTTGEEKWIRGTWVPIGADTIMLHTEDISERKQAEQALSESEQRWRNILVNTPQIGISLDPQGKIAFANTHFLELTGWKEEEIIGQDWFELFIPSNIRAEVRDIFAYTMKQKDVHGFSNYENKIITKQGKILNIGWSNVLTKDPHNNILDVTCLGIDHTERKRAEEELRQAHKLEALGTLAGGISHEFNNMLGVIIGNIELAEDEIPEWSPVVENIREIRTAAMRARDVVRKLMSVARKAPASKNQIQINTIVNEALDLIRRTTPATVDIRRNLRCKSEMIFADATEINQILINLCNNSAHAMKEGVGVIKVDLEPITLNRPAAGHYDAIQPGKYVKLTVRDTGKGIAPEIIDRVFDPYFTTKDVDEGLGMGMAVVLGIVKKHDGTIKIESEVGKSTTVEILFPLIESASAICENGEQEALMGGSERILCVDDEEAITKMFQRILERLGYKITVKTNPQDALELFRSDCDSFDLVITDMAMPFMNGIAFSKKIKEVREKIPVILCTGQSDLLNETHSDEMGVDAYITKPVTQKEMATVVRTVLDNNASGKTEVSP